MVTYENPETFKSKLSNNGILLKKLAVTKDHSDS